MPPYLRNDNISGAISFKIGIIFSPLLYINISSIWRLNDYDTLKMSAFVLSWHNFLNID